jgi:hypothetical protein
MKKETTYAQVTESLKVVLTNIQHRPEVLQRFKATTHKPLVKALSSFENMKSHGEPIKPVLHQLITLTPPKERITLLELFCGISTGLVTLLQSRIVATLALGSQPKQGLTRVRAKREAWEPHLMLSRM